MCPKVKKLLSTFLSVFSLVNVFFLPEWINFFGEHSRDAALLTPTPFLNAYFAMSLTVFGLSVLLTIVIFQAEKYNFKKTNLLIHGLLLLSMAVTINFIREATGLFYRVPQLSYAVHFFTGPDFLLAKIVLTAVLLISVSRFAWSNQKQLVPGVRLIGLILSPLIIICYGNLGNSFLRSAKFDPIPTLTSKNKSNVKSNSPKLLWMIFDEMDFRLVFEQRPSDVKLPELDRLKQESIFLTKAYPPSDYTLHSIPSLIVGQKVDVTEITPADLILSTENKSKKNEKWTELSNVFKTAKQNGYSTAIVGWYHSYCRVLKSDLDFCRRLPGGRFGYSSHFWGSVGAILNRSTIVDRRLERAFIYNLEEMQDVALSNLQSKQYDFNFFHFSVPHKPYIFDSEKMRLSAKVTRAPKSYFGNLEMVDRILGDIRKTMISTGEWNDTVVILSSDHSWRKSEEYDGKRDYRVPFIVKMPDSQSVTFNNAFPTLLTEDFIGDIITKKLKTTPEVVKWLKINGSEFPKGTVLSEPKKDKDSTVGKLSSLDDIHS